MLSGAHKPPETEELYQARRTTIVRHMAIVVIVLAVFYTILNYFIETNIQPILLIGTFVGGGVTYFLNEFRYSRAAKILGLVIINTIVFLAASSESQDTGIYLYFGATGLAALLMFGYEDRWIGFLFIALSAFLYMLTRFSDIQFLNYRNFTPEQIRTFFVINVCVFSYVSAYVVIVMMKVNHESEKALVENNIKIRNQNDKLLKANNELDKFMYSTSHDMRAPLSSLSGLIKLSEFSTSPAELKEYLQLMKGSIRNLEKFTHSITDHYRNARTEVSYSAVYLTLLIDDVIRDHLFIDGAGKADFTINVDKALVVKTDPARLRVVLNNIISNAIKYQDPKRVLTIEINYGCRQKMHVLSIEDNGLGIDKAHVGKVFDMFYRASENSKGSGLGLYIVKETLDKLGGQIEVASAPNVGTTFTILLPIVD